MTEVITLDVVTSVSSVCLSSNNVPRAFSSKWKAGLEEPGAGGWGGVCPDDTLAMPKLLSYVCVCNLTSSLTVTADKIS